MVGDIMKRIHFESEHETFRQSFQSFLKKEVLPHQETWERAGIVPRDVWQKAGQEGFLVTWADEQYGGSGVKDFRFDQIICEELAYANENGLMLPLQSSLCAPYLEVFGTAEQKKRFLPGV